MTDEATNPGADDAVRDDQPGVDAEAESEALLRGEPPEEAEGDDDPQPEPVDDDEEVEFDGKKFRAPKGVKDGILRQADYTRKTQELADQRKAFEAERKSAPMPAKEIIEGIADVRNLNRQLADIDSLKPEDWDQIDELDRADGGNRARQLERKKAQLIAARDDLVGKLQTQERQRAEAEQSDRTKRHQEAAAVLSKDIPGWGPDLAKKVTDFGVSQGFTAAELAEVDDPRHVKILNLAMEGLAARTKAAAAKKAAAATSAPPPPQPVKGSGSPGKTLGQAARSDDFAEFEKLAAKSIKPR